MANPTPSSTPISAPGAADTGFYGTQWTCPQACLSFKSASTSFLQMMGVDVIVHRVVGFAASDFLVYRLNSLATSPSTISFSGVISPPAMRGTMEGCRLSACCQEKCRLLRRCACYPARQSFQQLADPADGMVCRFHSHCRFPCFSDHFIEWWIFPTRNLGYRS